MKDLVLDLINSYENRVVAVESLITSAYETAIDNGDGLSQAYEIEQKLKADLRETLVRNRSLRRADFNNFTSKIFDDIEAKRAEIEQERKLLRERLKAYLERQKEMVSALKEQLTKLNMEGSGQENVAAILSDIKTSQKQDEEQNFALLRDFQLRLKLFHQKLDELNNKMRRTLERGDLLKLEDLRQLQAALTGEQRKAERKLRKEDVQRLLAHFRWERQGSIH